MNNTTPLKKTNTKTNVEECLKRSIRELLDQQDVKNAALKGNAENQLFVDAEMLKRFIASRVKVELEKRLPKG